MPHPLSPCRSSSPLPRLFLPLLLLLLPVGVQSTRSLWHLQRVPAVLPLQTAARPNPHFLAPPQLEVNSSCDPACHRAAPRPTYRDLQQLLAFQTLHSNGRLTETAVGIYLAPPPPAPPSARQEAPPPAPVRRKRQIFGHDGRFSIAGRDHLLLYPFSTAVKLSTGCSGTLVGERHVLTAAHCVHDGRSYVKGAQKLRVGFLRPSRRDSSPPTPSNLTTNHVEAALGGPAYPPPSDHKMRFQWIRARRTHVPKGWLVKEGGGANDIGMDYDYALLELKKAHKRRHMRLGISPPARRLPGHRVQFSGFDNDRPGRLVYRFCRAGEETPDLLYQHCDAQPGASGSGVYARMWEGRGRGRWERKVIGVFSGHQWVEQQGTAREFNVAVRITPLKYAQICYWIHGDFLNCHMSGRPRPPAPPGDPKLGNTDGFNLLSRGGGGGRGEERMSPPAPPGSTCGPPAPPGSTCGPPAPPGSTCAPSTPRVHLRPPSTPRVHLQPPSTPGYTCRHPAPPGSTCSPPAPPGPTAQHPATSPPAPPGPPAAPSTPPGPPAAPQHPRVHLRPPSTPGSNCSPPAPCGAPGQRCSRVHPLSVALQRVPAVLPLQTAARPNPTSWPAPVEVNSSCDPACHRAAPRPTYRDLQQLLAFQTLHSNGRLTETAVGIYLAPPPPAPPSARQEAPPPAPVRRKRQIFGHDGRFSIAGRDHLLLYPFSTAVKLSTGCSGTLVGERHVLTAAHCVHDGRSYVKGAQKLRVGFLRPSRRDSSPPTPSNLTTNHVEAALGGPAYPPPSDHKMRFQWIRARRTHVPKGWLVKEGGGANDIGMDYDYALLELKKAHKRRHMRLGISPPARRLPGRRVQFSGFDNDRPGRLVYRFCRAGEETPDLLYQHCDARPGASGSGVYARMWEGRGRGRWERKVIGVFSGHQWVEQQGTAREFNVAVRITPLKYAQICYWIHGDFLNCREG
ncbi:hypothetical protein CRUP_010523 [Coryphaenoides rupestris]|nr:hypothetical protein CRUP_010523 [Coryphaenoides rupestris]